MVFVSSSPASFSDRFSSLPQDIFVILTSSCARFVPRRRGYNQLPTSSRGRDAEANGLMDQYDDDL